LHLRSRRHGISAGDHRGLHLYTLARPDPGGLCRIVSTSNFEEVVKAHQRLADRPKSRLLLLQQRSKRSRSQECELANSYDLMLAAIAIASPEPSWPQDK